MKSRVGIVMFGKATSHTKLALQLYSSRFIANRFDCPFSFCCMPSKPVPSRCRKCTPHAPKTGQGRQHKQPYPHQVPVTKKRACSQLPVQLNFNSEHTVHDITTLPRAVHLPALGEPCVHASTAVLPQRVKMGTNQNRDFQTFAEAPPSDPDSAAAPPSSGIDRSTTSFWLLMLEYKNRGSRRQLRGASATKRDARRSCSSAPCAARVKKCAG